VYNKPRAGAEVDLATSPYMPTDGAPEHGVAGSPDLANDI